MAALAVNSNFYKEYQGIDYLSKTFQSSLRFTPNDVARRTVSQENFKRQREKEKRLSKEPWGRRFSYGAIAAVCLPDNKRPKDEPPRVQKGHRHFGAGVCVNPRYVTIKERYAETSIRRSNVRVTDELIESPHKVDITKHAINLKFPAEHPFATHMERASVFPPYEIPAANENSKSITELPAAAPDIEILSKARGSAYRYEKSATPREWERKPVEWLEGPNFYQLPKGREKERQRYFPIPIKSLDPNMRFPRDVSDETGTALKHLKKEQWTSTYQRHMTSGEAFQSKYVTCLDKRDTAGNSTEEKQNQDEESKVDLNVPLVAEENPVESTPKSVHFDLDTTRDDVNPNQTDTAENSTSLAPQVSIESPMYATVRGKPGDFINASYPPDQSMQRPYSMEHNTRGRVYSDELIRGWSRSDIRRKFNRAHQDQTPDLRRKPDLRITTNERRHRFPDLGDVSSYVWNGLATPHLAGTVNG